MEYAPTDLEDAGEQAEEGLFVRREDVVNTYYFATRDMNAKVNWT